MRGDVSPMKPSAEDSPVPPKMPRMKQKSSRARNDDSDVEMQNVSPPPPPPRLKSSRNMNNSEESKDYARVSSDVELGRMEESKSSAPVERRKEKEAVVEKREPRGGNSGKPNRFKGANVLQYGLWAHYLGYGAAMMCVCMGSFAALWRDARTYGCHIDGDQISPIFLYPPNKVCPTIYVGPNGKPNAVCCNENASSGLQGYWQIGVVYILYGLFLVAYENPNWGYGLWFPNDTIWYKMRVSPIGITNMIFGVVGLYNYATCLAGAFLLITGVVYNHAVSRFESGDGGREANKKAKEAAKLKKQKENEEKTYSQRIAESVHHVLSFNPVTFCTRIYNEDKMASYVWVGIFLIINFITFVYTLDVWYTVIYNMRNGLLDGTLDVLCDSLQCKVNRKAVKYGPISLYAPWAKACGGCLNLDCALLLLPVVRMLIRKINNWGESFSMQQHSNDIMGRLFARPMTRYIPLQKNIEFHKLCAISVFCFALAHMIFHFLNLWVANNATLRQFRFARWNGTDFLTGAIVATAMFLIYTAAPDNVRLAKYEVFFRAHHFFIVFYLAMFIHGPVFFYWTCIPVLLYIAERYMQTLRGNRPFQVIKVEYIAPVMAIYFRPVFKEDFPFKEGQYLYLNCPFISPSEWHPFTISSASDDLNGSTRIHLESGEEVIEVPRPKNLPPKARWNKYCLVSEDWQSMDPNEYMDKSETGFFDYVTVHVKVHGLEEAVARSWTRKLKEYFELMSPGSKFPFYFFRRDQRGEIAMGRQYGPDGTSQILRVDGPHAAPAEHYARYSTLMLIGAGIGLTPCVSILTSLTKYRWRKNFNPELLHFYWIVRQNEMDSFQWLVHMLTEISFELKRARMANQIERRYYCEINIYVTGVEKEKKIAQPLYRSKRKFSNMPNCQPTFSADELYEKILNPTVDSRGQMAKMKEGSRAENRLQDIWIWNGRPHWDEIFREMKAQRQHSDIGVCFCGAPVIGADLRSMCEKYSNAAEDCLFSLHKENF